MGRKLSRIAGYVGLVFGFLGLQGQPMLLLIALFVWIGAASEAKPAKAGAKAGHARGGVADAGWTRRQGPAG